MIAGCFAVYSAIFAAGYYMYGQIIYGIIFTVVGIIGVVCLVSIWGKLEMK
jgi:hypothetical protein